MAIASAVGEGFLVHGHTLSSAVSVTVAGVRLASLQQFVPLSHTCVCVFSFPYRMVLPLPCGFTTTPTLAAHQPWRDTSYSLQAYVSHGMIQECP